MSRRHRTFLSLFCGCGGLDSGFLSKGFRRTGAVDIDPLALTTYASNLGAANIFQFDVRHWRALLSVERPTVLIAGPPCQGFSLVGRMQPSDPRNRLFTIPLRLGIALNAEAIVIENVPGITSSRYRSIWRRAQRLLDNAGYSYSVHSINVVDLGLPQLRTRIVLLASRGKEIATFRPPVKPRTVLSDVLDVPARASNHRATYLPRKTREGTIARSIKQGQKLCNVRGGTNAVHTWQIPEVFGNTTAQEREVLEAMIKLRRTHRQRAEGDADPVTIATVERTVGPRARAIVNALLGKGYMRRARSGRVDLTHTFNGKFRRLPADGPSHSVLSTYCDPTHFLHPFEHRGFTAREAARVQGFADDFSFVGSTTHQARVIGNAVPPALSCVLADWALDTIG